MEKTIETKTCKKCSANFEITDKDLEFYKKVSPKFSGKTYEIPTPTFCPDCRQQRRLSFRNERKLYKRKCDATGENIISMFSPDKNLKVYNQDFWWSDKWDAMDYGIEFDFSIAFFEQFGKLFKDVPNQGLIINSTFENSSYLNYGKNSKNVYMSFGADTSENILYSHTSFLSKNDIDGLMNFESDNCYETIYSKKGFNLYFSKNVENCSNSYFLYDSKNCEYCFACKNLFNRKYYIFNKQYTKENYFIEMNKLLNLGIYNIKKRFTFFIKKIPNINLKIDESENCYGNYINNSFNSKNCFDINGGNSCGYIYSAGGKIEDCYDLTSAGGVISKNYENMSNINSNNILFSNNVIDSNDLIYCKFCVNNCSNLFGCIGLKNKQYCILNKQYTKEEYEELVPKIIEHMKTPLLTKEGQGEVEWGEFFPSSLSPFGYNETVAQEYFPIPHPASPEGEGFNWSDYEAPTPQVEKVIPAEKLPEDITKIPDDILNWAIKCEESGKLFRIISQELEFYRKHNLPIPKKHPDVRHLERMKLRNPRKLFDRNCNKCGVEMKTTYSPEREEIVYCEKCYEKEVY